MTDDDSCVPVFSADLVDIRYTKLLAEVTPPEEISADSRDESDPSDGERHSKPSAVATPGDDGEPQAVPRPVHIERQSWQMAINISHAHIDVTVTLDVQTNGAVFKVEVVGHYHIDDDRSDDIEFDEKSHKVTSLRFAEKEAYPTLLPYVREAADDLARRIKVRAPRISTKSPKGMHKAIDRGVWEE